jgi:Ca2+-binding RTX toxin-like protein
LSGCFVGVRGGYGYDALKVLDSGYSGAETYNVTGQDLTVAGLPGFDVFYGGGEVEYLGLITGGGDNQIRVYGIAPGMSASVWTGSGTDTLWGPSVDSTWGLTGFGTGTLNGTIGFGGVENLAGGAGNDTFSFGPAADGSGVAGWIDGGAGFDILNYTGYGAPYSTAPGPGATGTGAGAWNIEWVV